MPKQQLLITVVIPTYNEADNLPGLVKALQIVLSQLQQFNFELLVVDDGSRDETVNIVKELKQKESRLRLIELARNFGKEIATSAGLHNAKGDAAIIIDADLQHPPELIPQFLERWQAGDDIVIGRQKLHASYASLTKRVTSRWYYRIINRLSPTPVVPHATDFRLLDRTVIDEFNHFTEHNRMTRGLIDWLGFRRSYIDFTPIKRQHGPRSYSYRKLFKLATDSIISLSFFPLRIAGYLGIIIVLFASALLAFIGYDKFLHHNAFNISGSATLATFITLLVGIVLICQGLVALYIENIYHEVQNRPLYVIKRPRNVRK